MMTDREIAILITDGRMEEAFNELVKSYSERLYWHVRRFLCSHEDTDDLLQEIFVKIWTALPSFRGESQLFTWIYRIATNEALNHLQKMKIRQALKFSSIDTIMEDRIQDDPWFNGDEAQRALSKAIQRLPSRQKAVFLMRYYDEIPYEDMAKIMGISTGALKASYHLAREKVQEYLLKEIGGEIKPQLNKNVK